VLGLITNVMQHMVKLEHDLYSHLEAQLANISSSMDSRLKDLGSCFADALDMERTLRTHEIVEVRADLDAIKPKQAEAAGAVNDLQQLTKVAKQEWDSLASRLSGLQSQLANDLSEQHARAALDLAERHIEVSRSLDARTEELAGLQMQLSTNLQLSNNMHAPAATSSTSVTPRTARGCDANHVVPVPAQLPASVPVPVAVQNKVAVVAAGPFPGRPAEIRRYVSTGILPTMPCSAATAPTARFQGRADDEPSSEQTAECGSRLRL